MPTLYYDPGRGLRAATVNIPQPPTLPSGAVLVSPLCVVLGSYERKHLRTASSGSVVGREGVFVVQAVASDVNSSLLGARIVAEAYVSCGLCDRCSGGIKHLCATRTVRCGGLGAPLVMLPAGSFEAVAPGIDTPSASIAQSLAACVHTVRIARAEKNNYITILGDGPMAILTALVARVGNSYVRVLGHNPERFTVLERVGIKHRHASQAGKRNDQHIVIDCSGDDTGQSLLLAAGHVVPRGKVIMKAPLCPPSAVSPVRQDSAHTGIHALSSLEATLIGAGAGSVRDGLAFLTRHPIDPTLVLSRRTTVARTAETVDALLDPRTLLCSVEWPAT